VWKLHHIVLGEEYYYITTYCGDIKYFLESLDSEFVEIGSLLAHTFGWEEPCYKGLEITPKKYFVFTERSTHSEFAQISNLPSLGSLW
jgi:hypothetical protein